MEKKYKDKVKEYYARHAKNYIKDTTAWRIELIKKYGKKEGNILDLGCGTGNYTLYAIRFNNSKIYGIDMSKESIDVLRHRKEYITNKNKIKVFIGDALHTPFKKDMFNTIFSFSTLYYIKELDLIIKEISRILKKDGIAILEFGNKYSVESTWDKMSFDCPQFHFSEKEIRKELEKNNLKVKEIYYRQIIPNFWNKFDKDFIHNRLLQKISFRMIFIVEKMNKR